MARSNWLALAALGGFVSVAAGAFGAHAATDPQAREWLRTGALYGLTHSLAVYAAAFVGARKAQPLFLAGVVLFSGSLYAMAAGAPRILGAVTPLGGLCFLAAWLLVAWTARKAR